MNKCRCCQGTCDCEYGCFHVHNEEGFDKEEDLDRRWENENTAD